MKCPFTLLTTLTLFSCGISKPKTVVNEIGTPAITQQSEKVDSTPETRYATVYNGSNTDTSLQVSQYIRRIFQDRNGNLWFGTNNDGVCRYDGDSLVYFSVGSGFGGYAVRGIDEDQNGNLWFATDLGVTKYDGKQFSNYTTENGLISNDVWSILVDHSGTIWAGTHEGACRFTGQTTANGDPLFTEFKIPEPTKVNPVRDIGTKIIWQMLEDRTGNIWFTTYGGGAYYFDGNALTNISEKDGLSDPFVNCILQDKGGNIWFATTQDGVFRYTIEVAKSQPDDKIIMTNFTPREGLSGYEVWTIMEDHEGNLWFSTRGSVCRYNPNESKPKFVVYTEADGLTNCCVQSIFEDKSGKIWFGSGDGLFRFQGDYPPPGEPKFIHVTKNGPWK